MNEFIEEHLQVTAEAAAAELKRHRQVVTAQTYAVDLILATPQDLEGGLAYIVARTQEDKAYGENIMDTLDCFDGLQDYEKGDLTGDQLDIYKQRSYQVTEALMNVLSPLPATVLPQ